MRCWRPFCGVLALLPALRAHSEQPLFPEEEAGSAPSLEDTRNWEPCGHRATPLTSPVGAEGLGPSELVHGDQVLLFMVEDGEGGLDLWRSNGSRGAGTSLVKDCHSGPRVAAMATPEE